MSPWLSWGVCSYPAVLFHTDYRLKMSNCPISLWIAILSATTRVNARKSILATHSTPGVFSFLFISEASSCNRFYTSIMVLTPSTSQMIDTPQITTTVLIKASGALSVTGSQESTALTGVRRMKATWCSTITEGTSASHFIHLILKKKNRAAAISKFVKWLTRPYYKSHTYQP